MGSVKGLLTTCDRCGVSVFSKLTGRETFDGGYSSRDTFEELPEGWEYATVKGKYGHLCPECSRAWLDIGTAFLDQVPITIQGHGKRIDPAIFDDKTESGILED